MRRVLIVAGALIAWLGGCHTHEAGKGDRTPAAEKKAEQEGQDKQDQPVHENISSGRPVRPTPSGYLSHDAIVKIQHALVVKGEHVPSTGKLDGATTAALKRFQKSQHQPDTGYPDFGTLDRLGLKATELYGGKPDKDTHAAGLEK